MKNSCVSSRILTVKENGNEDDEAGEETKKNLGLSSISFLYKLLCFPRVVYYCKEKNNIILNLLTKSMVAFVHC